ncbi:MAG: sigma-70 family RNA polymerase sigma factor [Planctomycetota bacterium]
MADSADNTRTLLLQIQAGDAAAQGKLFQLVYDQLRGIADALFRQQPANHTLQPTALVNEAYLRLAGRDREWEGRSHFVDVAAKSMRCVLIDHARKRNASKRGGQQERVAVTDSVVLVPQVDVDVLQLEEAMLELEKLNARKSRVVELRFYGGMTMQEIASLLEISPKTVEADWYFARAWLRDYMDRADRGPTDVG